MIVNYIDMTFLVITHLNENPRSNIFFNNIIANL